MSKLLADLGQQKPVRKGETLYEFFGTPKYARRRAERITDWLTRFEEGISRLIEDEVDLTKIEDVAGWFLLFRAGLTVDRKERVVASLPDEHFPYEAIKKSLIRMYPELRTQERSAMPPTHHQPRGQPRHQASSSHHRQSLEVAVDDQQPDPVEPAESDASDINPGELQDICRSELEALSAELEGADLEDALGPEETARLESAAIELSGVSEALATIRNARERIGNHRRTPQQPGRKPKPQPASGSKPAVAPKRSAARPTSSALKDKIQSRKAKSVCHDCGEMGHWAGDDVCRGKRAHGHGTHITDYEPFLDTSGGYNAIEESTEAERSVTVCERHDPARPALVTASDAQCHDPCVGIIDTACLYSVAGERWWHHYRDTLVALGLEDEILEESELEKYRFGNGGTLDSKTRVTVPIVVANRPTRIAFSVVPSDGLSLLIGRDFLSALGIQLDCGKGILRWKGSTSELTTSRAGHYGLPLRPDLWPILTRSQLPSKLAQRSGAKPATVNTTGQCLITTSGHDGGHQSPGHLREGGSRSSDGLRHVLETLLGDRRDSAHRDGRRSDDHLRDEHASVGLSQPSQNLLPRKLRPRSDPRVTSRLAGRFSKLLATILVCTQSKGVTAQHPEFNATSVAPHHFPGLARATLSEALQTTVSFPDQPVASVNPAPCVAVCNTCTCASDVLVCSSCNSGVCNDCIACSLCPECLTPEPSRIIPN